MTDNAFSQGRIYTTSQSNIIWDEINPGTNLTGLGTPQAIVVKNALAEPIGAKIAFQFEVAVPAPLVYFQATGTDSFIIITPQGQTLTLTKSPSSTAYYFQPAADQKYEVIFTCGTLKAINSTLLEIQTVIQNTLGQYLDMANKETINSSIGSIEERTTISGNTTSAIPNTLVYRFNNIPLRAGPNLLVTIPVLANATGVLTVSGNNIPTGMGMAPTSVVLTAGQNWSYTYSSGTDGFFSGTIQLLINNVGITQLVPALTITPTYAMGEFIQRNRQIAEGLFAGVSGSTADVAILGKMDALFDEIKQLRRLVDKDGYDNRLVYRRVK